MSVTIIGLGLIGGSLGLALRQTPLALLVTGWDHDRAALTTALAQGAIDHAAPALPDAVAHSDIVVLATPVLAVRPLLEAIAPHLSAEAIVTDVASTKAQVLTWAQRLLPTTVSFIGGHPMAGSEQHGIRHARADLFHGALYCLVPLPSTPPTAIAKLQHLIACLGARPLLLAPSTHDPAVAAISHLPFLVASALVQLTTGDARWGEYGRLAATGYRDMTRLAAATRSCIATSA